jgi:hypothetical protein
VYTPELFGFFIVALTASIGIMSAVPETVAETAPKLGPAPNPQPTLVWPPTL